MEIKRVSVIVNEVELSTDVMIMEGDEQKEIVTAVLEKFESAGVKIPALSIYDFKIEQEV